MPSNLHEGDPRSLSSQGLQRQGLEFRRTVLVKPLFRPRLRSTLSVAVRIHYNVRALIFIHDHDVWLRV